MIPRPRQLASFCADGSAFCCWLTLLAMLLHRALWATSAVWILLVMTVHRRWYPPSHLIVRLYGGWPVACVIDVIVLRLMVPALSFLGDWLLLLDGDDVPGLPAAKRMV